MMYFLYSPLATVILPPQHVLHQVQLFLLIGLVILLTTNAVLSNPYGYINRVKNPHTTSKRPGESMTLSHVFELRVHTSLLMRAIAYYKCAWHIVSNVYTGKHRSKKRDIEKIIQDIHTLRFNPRKPYLISGDHFNVFYPRNLGVFYHATLDSRTALNETDWLHRQQLYLQSVAYALDVFAVLGDCTTTIVPVGPKDVCPVNIYHYPSDSLYGILYALALLQDNKSFHTQYPFKNITSYALCTQEATQILLAEHSTTISILFKRYFERVFDVKSGLIRTNIHLSSAKDAALRTSSFYDNVIFWKTYTLACELGIKELPSINPDELKERIIKTFWFEEGGYFLEDLSSESLKDKSYSADWLCVLFTGFLNVATPRERTYLERSIDYTIQKKLDIPFPLRYQEKNRKQKQPLTTRLFASNYGGTSIWSFWGAEFISLLILLHRHNPQKRYLALAEKHIQAYKKNILSYRGYPEVYATNGSILQTPVYKSICRTGWIVDFELAHSLFQSAKKE